MILLEIPLDSKVTSFPFLLILCGNKVKAKWQKQKEKQRTIANKTETNKKDNHLELIVKENNKCLVFTF